MNPSPHSRIYEQKQNGNTTTVVSTSFTGAKFHFIISAVNCSINTPYVFGRLSFANAEAAGCGFSCAAPLFDLHPRQRENTMRRNMTRLSILFLVQSNGGFSVNSLFSSQLLNFSTVFKGATSHYTLLSSNCRRNRFRRTIISENRNEFGRSPRCARVGSTPSGASRRRPSGLGLALGPSNFRM
jgi:hypothetical protein